MGFGIRAARLGRMAGSVLRTASTSAYRKVRDPEAVRALVSGLALPDAPITYPWEASAAALVTSHPMAPALAAGLFRRLDQFGRIAIGPRGVGFDGHDVAWEEIIEVRVHSTVDMVPRVVMHREVDRIRELFPPVPGRRWVVSRAADAMLTLVMAAAHRPERDTATAPEVPCELVYRRRLGRTRTLSAGLFATTILVVVPEASHSLIASAHARGIPVRTVRDSSAGARAARARWLRRYTATLVQRLRERRAEQANAALDRSPAAAGHARLGPGDAAGHGAATDASTPDNVNGPTADHSTAGTSASSALARSASGSR
jgi:hypothetical protein